MRGSKDTHKIHLSLIITSYPTPSPKKTSHHFVIVKIYAKNQSTFEILSLAQSEDNKITIKHPAAPIIAKKYLLIDYVTTGEQN